MGSAFSAGSERSAIAGMGGIIGGIVMDVPPLSRCAYSIINCGTIDCVNGLVMEMMQWIMPRIAIP